MNLSLLRENKASTDEVGWSGHFRSTNNLTISHVEVECFIRKVHFLSTFNCWMSIIFLISWLNTTEYQDLLSCNLVAAGVQQPQAVALGNVVDDFPLILLDFVDFNIAYELERLISAHILDICTVLKLLATEHKYVLVIEGGHTEALSSVIHCRDLGPCIVLEAVHLAGREALNLG